MIYWIEGQFWSWKTSFATWLAIQFVKFNKSKLSKIEYKKLIEETKNLTKKEEEKIQNCILNNELYSSSEMLDFSQIKRKKMLNWVFWKGRTIVLSNIKFNELSMSNYFYFDDDKFLEVLRTVNLINDLERLLFFKNSPFSNLKIRERSKFTKFKIFYDEATAIQWARDSIGKLAKGENIAQEIYIMQNRKLFTDIYIMWADGNQNDKSLRRHVEWWYNVEKLPFPFDFIPGLKDIWIIKKHKKDEEWKIAMQSYVWKDQQGEYIVKQKPIMFTDWFFYKPWVWSFYDDLHKNINDENKYNIDLTLAKQIIAWNEILETKFNNILSQ